MPAKCLCLSPLLQAHRVYPSLAKSRAWFGLASVAKCHSHDYGNSIVLGGENKERENCIVEGGQEIRSVLLSIWGGGRVSGIFMHSSAFMCTLTLTLLIPTFIKSLALIPVHCMMLEDY